MFRRLFYTCFLVIEVLMCSPIAAQTLGGNTVFNFLKLPNTPQLSALGGVNVSNISNDVGLVFNNPAFLKAEMHTQMQASFNAMYAGIQHYALTGAYHVEPLKTTLAFGANYIDYGTLPQTDAAGNSLGNFHPTDYNIKITASRRYEKHWIYGASFTFIHSSYGIYRSTGLAMDVGVCYEDTVKLFKVGFTARNMGVQIKPYEGTTAGDLPFDLDIGITKRLARAPIQFSVTAQHLQSFNITYNDSIFNADNGYPDAGKSGFSFDKLFRHFIFASQIFVSDKLELTLGYNYLRRKELNIGNSGNGLTGFSFGVGILLQKLQIRYARSSYQNNTGYNQFAVSFTLR